MTHRYISVFSGIGSMDLGLQAADWQPALVSDNDPAACATLKAVVPAPAVVAADIHDLLNAGAFSTRANAAPPVLVAGQPPLFTRHDGTAQYVNPDGEAPQMLYRFMDVVEQAAPSAFLMATRPFVNGPRWGAVLGRLRATARQLGFDLCACVMNAADYGVPQNKDRLFLIGMPRGCKFTLPSHKGDRVSAGLALRSLLREGARDAPCMASVTLATKPVLRNSPYSGVLVNGRIMDLRRPAPTLTSDLGGNKTPVIDLDQLERGEDPWVERYHDFLWRLGGTPAAFDGTPGRMRRLTLRECAALQGLPANHPLHGAPLHQFKLVGSALPPALAETAGRSVMAALS